MASTFVLRGREIKGRLEGAVRASAPRAAPVPGP